VNGNLIDLSPRRADSRVNQEWFFASISDETRDKPRKMLTEIDVEWKNVIKAAKAMA